MDEEVFLMRNGANHSKNRKYDRLVQTKKVLKRTRARHNKTGEKCACGEVLSSKSDDKKRCAFDTNSCVESIQDTKGC